MALSQPLRIGTKVGVLTAVNPLLLWGVTAIAVPIAIHLLLRQRPRPRAWAAMRWLLAAMEQAQRRYRITNLLLLLLRCLILAILALALARPNWSILGRGGNMTLIVDITASMGARGDQPGPLADAITALNTADISEYLTVITVGSSANVVITGTADEAVQALQRIAPEPIPGGLDRAATVGGSDVLSLLSDRSDVVLVSDFQQDDGTALVRLLESHVRSVRRWTVGEPVGNAAIIGLDRTIDPLPNTSSEAIPTIIGVQSGNVRLAIDGGPATAAGTDGRLIIPPLEAGDHRLFITIADAGLHYDNRLEIPIRIRGALPMVLAQEHTDYLAASLLADDKYAVPATGDRHMILPAQIAAEGLPNRGLVVLRGRSGDDRRLAEWVSKGGVLWSDLATLRDEPALAALISDIAVGEAVDSAPFISGMRDLDEAFATAKPPSVLAVTALPKNAAVLLLAGTTPVVVSIPVDRGTIIVEVNQVSGDPGFTARGATPLWVRRIIRQATADIDQPLWWEAGQPAPAHAELRRAGLITTATVEAPLLAEPGAYTDQTGRIVIVTPNQDEAHIDRGVTGGSSTIADVLPQRRGADWGLPLLCLALLIVLGEGALAAWAGKHYGR